MRKIQIMTDSASDISYEDEPAAMYQIGAAVAANSGPKVVGIAFTRKKPD